MAGLVMQAGGELVLPALRADLSLLAGSAAEDGSPTWLIHDTSRNRYFRLGLEAFRALGHWQAGLAGAEFLRRCEAQGLTIDEEDLKGLVQFVLVNQLAEVRDKAGLQRLLEQHRRAQHHWFKWLLHNYLFVRIPLWRPDAFLSRTWPAVSRLLQPQLLWVVRILGLIGVLMVIRQWEVFAATFLHFLSWEGLALYGVTLAVVKSAHELGHAYIAKKYGCRVGSIGVAIMLLFPVLYTDTSDAWRLRSSRDRLRIVVAGIGTELHLAMLATFAWSFLPDGPLRSVAFFVATTSWITSLLVNLSPFMRFDGYFALSDLLRAENLQPRSFALARWRLREWLFGLGEPVPEVLPAWRHKLFIAYAYATWLYRLVLFLGIAVLVYHFAFKLLGIVLFAVEIAWFILMPMKNEMHQWWLRRRTMRLNRNTLLTLCALTLLLLALVMPWRSTVHVPAVLLAGQFQPVYASERGRVVEILVRQGDSVAPGAPLIRLAQPELDHAMAQTRRELALVEQRIERQAGSARDLQDALVLTQQQQELRTRLQSLQQRLERLTLHAPLEGQVSQMESLQMGQWVSENAPLLTLRSAQGLRLMALAPADALYRLEAGASAVWISDLPGSPRLDLQLSRIDQTAVQHLGWPGRASDYGGPVPTRKDAHQQLRPEGAWYQLELQAVQTPAAPSQQQTGQVLIRARAESLLGHYWRYAAAVWVRESGF
jgi:putative peptide zinc metalloprotease protein